MATPVPGWLQWIDGAGIDQGTGITTDPSGNIYVIGLSTSSGSSVIRFGDNATYTKPVTTSTAAFIGKFNPLGVAQWLQWIDGVGVDQGTGVVADSLGHVYMSG